jgi:hypothetical protein
MSMNTFWTRRRFTGITLIVSCLLYVGAGALLPKDTQGNYIVNLPLRDQLLVVFAHPTLWQWDTGLFISGVIVMLMGLAMLTMLFRDAGDRVFSPLALIAFLFGAVVFVIDIAFSLGVDPVAAQVTARTGVVPDYYVPLTLWTQALFVIYTILAFSAFAAYGGAVLTTRVLPHWLGWLAIVYGLAGLGLVGFTGDADPFLHLVMPILIGILLLLRRSHLPARSHRDEASTAASPTAVTGGKQ